MRSAGDGGGAGALAEGPPPRGGPSGGGCDDAPARLAPAARAVLEVIDETPTVRTLVVSDDGLHAARPGQFAMVWVPGRGELPMSVMIAPGDGAGTAAFTVRRHGPSSTGLYETPVGGLVGVRGPFGNSFSPCAGRALLVGGGTGMVPLVRLLARSRPAGGATVVIGARTAGEVFFDRLAADLLRGVDHEVIVATEDGTAGRRGFATDVARELCEGRGAGAFDRAYTCGPEIMMAKAVAIANERGLPVEASVERVMKCGVGMCGSCCMGAELVCADGTVFDGLRLAANPDFGRSYRSKCGAAEPYGDRATS